MTAQKSLNVKHHDGPHGAFNIIPVLSLNYDCMVLHEYPTFTFTFEYILLTLRSCIKKLEFLKGSYVLTFLVGYVLTYKTTKY